MDLQNQFALAEMLGMTVEELRERMSMSEFYHWIVYKKLEGKRLKEQQRNHHSDDDME